MTEDLYQAVMLLSWVVFGAVLTVYLKSGRASMFHPPTLYLAFHFLTFVLRPPVAYLNNYDALYAVYGFHPTWAEKSTVLLGANLALIVFVAVSLFFGNARPDLKKADPGERDRLLAPFAIVCAILLPIALYSLNSGLEVSFGSSEVTMTTVNGVAINTTGNGYMQDAQLVLPSLAVMFAFLNRFRLWSIIPLAAYVVARGVTGSRGPFIFGLTFFLLLYLVHIRRRWLDGPTLAVTVFSLAFFSFVGADRGASLRRLLGMQADRLANSGRFMESMDWANMEFFEYLVWAIPKRTGSFDYFLSWLQIFTEPIPRVLWPSKPIGAPIQMFNLFDYGNPIGMTASLPGAGWMAFGWLGIAVIATVFAFVYAKAYSSFMRSDQSPFAAMLFCAFMATSILAYRDGSVLTILKQGLFYLAPILLVKLTARAIGIDEGPSKRRPVGTPLVTQAETPRMRRRRIASGVPSE